MGTHNHYRGWEEKMPDIVGSISAKNENAPRPKADAELIADATRMCENFEDVL